MSKQTILQQSPSDKSQAAAASPTTSTSGVSLPAVPVFQLAYEGKRTMAEVPGLVKDLKEMGFLADAGQIDLLTRILAMNKDFELSDITSVLAGDIPLGPDTASRIETKEKKSKQEESDEEDGSTSSEKGPSGEDEYDFLSTAKTVEPKLPPFRLKPSGKQSLPPAAAAVPEKEHPIEVVFPPRTRAIILWAGSALTESQLGPIRAAYIQSYGDRPLKGQGDMEAEAATIEKTAKFDNPYAACSKSQIQQALEQEFIHTGVINTIRKKLEALGLVPTIIRPPDSSLISPKELQQLPWLPLGTAIDFSEAENSILITVGHGGPFGHTNFPGIGFKDYTAIKGFFNIPAIESAVLYIPLQCYPQKAVEKGKAAKVPSVSINTEGVSSDSEMREWIEGHLQHEIVQWALSRVKK